MKTEKNERYINWLIDNNITSKESAVSYDSYVRNALLCLELDMFQIQDINTVEDVIDVLSIKNTAQKFDKSPKTIQNYLSGLRAYGEFLNNEFGLNSCTIDTKVTTQLQKATNLYQMYLREDLFKNFIFRLITQDRFYQDIYFPISLIKQLFYKNNRKLAFDHILEKMVNSIKLYDSKQNVFLFQDIKQLKISNHKVFIEIESKGEVEIYTPTLSTNFESFNVISLRDISIDHVVSQHSIMQDLKDKLPIFSRLTEILQKSSTAVKDRPSLAIYKNEFGLDHILAEINLSDLENELNIIINKTELRLMDRRLNTSKGKN